MGARLLVEGGPGGWVFTVPVPPGEVITCCGRGNTVDLLLTPGGSRENPPQTKGMEAILRKLGLWEEKADHKKSRPKAA